MTDGTRQILKVMDYSIIEEFNRFWILFGVDETKFPKRRACTLRLWMDMPQERRNAIIDHLRRNGAQPDKNPYFFIQDFTVAEKTKEQPINYRGKSKLPKVPIFSAKYNGSWGMYTQADIVKFHMELPKN